MLGSNDRRGLMTGNGLDTREVWTMTKSTEDRRQTQLDEGFKNKGRRTPYVESKKPYAVQCTALTTSDGSAFVLGHAKEKKSRPTE